MTLQERLDRTASTLRRGLEPDELQELRQAIDRLRMLQLVEQGLGVGDVLPDFALPDAGGQVVGSDELLERGPLVVAFFRGSWCPYCSLALEALEEVRPEIERRGASLVAVAPVPTEELGRMAEERGLGLRLLSDPGAAYAELCGVRFEMPEGFTALYQRLSRRFGLAVPVVDPVAGWQPPVPATYVADRGGVVRYAFGGADWARWAEPADVVAAVERLAQAAEATA